MDSLLLGGVGEVGLRDTALTVHSACRSEGNWGYLRVQGLVLNWDPLSLLFMTPSIQISEAISSETDTVGPHLRWW